MIQPIGTNTPVWSRRPASPPVNARQRFGAAPLASVPVPSFPPLPAAFTSNVPNPGLPFNIFPTPSLPIAPPVLPMPINVWNGRPVSFQANNLPAPTYIPPIAVNGMLRPPLFPNKLKQMFHKNQAVIYALNIRTFGAHDINGDGYITKGLGENGTFLSSIAKLDQLKALGINTIHLLPINPIGQSRKLGEAGSLYAPSDYLSINPEFDQPGNYTNAAQEARQFVEACHQRGIQVMVDVPSCASEDLARTRPDLIARDKNGQKLTPTNWIDISMFENGEPLKQYYEGFFDLMVNQVGVDGFRVDVARARPTWFWQHFTQKYPDKAWLAESYCEEDQSPLKNLPRDIPEQLLRAGFDSMYGQFHIFHSMQNAKEYQDYLLSSRAMFQRASNQGGYDKSFIGSFLTHDDPSLMEHGGATMCILASGLMTTQPWTNPYILDGFTTGYRGDFDIFNYVPQHKGTHPEIGLFLNHMLKLRNSPAYGPVLTQGAFIPIPAKSDNEQIISYARQANGRTLLIIANKDVNARTTGTLNIPGMKRTQPLNDLAPSYGRPSEFYADENSMRVDLGPGRFHIFEIETTPDLSEKLLTY